MKIEKCLKPLGKRAAVNKENLMEIIRYPVISVTKLVTFNNTDLIPLLARIYLRTVFLPGYHTVPFKSRQLSCQKDPFTLT